MTVACCGLRARKFSRLHFWISQPPLSSCLPDDYFIHSWPCLSGLVFRHSHCSLIFSSLARQPSAKWLLLTSQSSSCKLLQQPLKPHHKCHFIVIHSPQCCQVFLYTSDHIISLLKIFASSPLPKVQSVVEDIKNNNYTL